MMKSKTESKKAERKRDILLLYLMGGIIAFSCAFLPSLDYGASKLCFAIAAMLGLIGFVLSAETSD